MINGLPDFLIIGAAKSGTTTLHYKLLEHPNIFMPSPKEPWFFSFYNNSPNYKSPDPLRGVISDLLEYKNIYRNSKSNQICGEASPSYLYTHGIAIQNIKKLYGNDYKKLKIIVVIRKQSERAFSQFNFFKKGMNEPLSFEDAISPQIIKSRMNENWNIFYDYIGFSTYSNGISEYFETFPSIKLILFDEIKDDLTNVLHEIHKFLGLPIYDIKNYSHYNKSGIPKKGKMYHFLYSIFLSIFINNKIIGTISSRLIPNFLRKRIRHLIEKFFLSKPVRDEVMMKAVQDCFNEDCKHLMKYLNPSQQKIMNDRWLTVED